MKILSLRLQNFQGVKAAEFEFHGENASVFGDNETGKTTLFNAVTWLLFGKSSTGAKSYLPKTKGADGVDVHKLEHSVQMVVLDDDGTVRTLRKVLKEKYTKKRGSTRAEFTGHSTDYYVDEVPLREQDYSEAMRLLMGGEEKARLLMMPFEFAETMPWDKRRQILMQVCGDMGGDIGDDQILEDNPDLAPLRDLLRVSKQGERMYSVDQYRAIVADKSRSLKKELDAIPVRVEEARRAIPEVRAVKKIEADMDVATRDLEAKKNALEQLRATDANTAARQQIAELTAQLEEARGSYMAKAQAAERATTDRLFAIEQMKKKIAQTLTDREMSKSRMEAMEKLREELHAQYGRIEAEQWSGAVCPTCGQQLPPEQLPAAQARFKEQRSQRLAEINQRGKRECSATMIGALKAEIGSWDEELRRTRESLDALQANMDKQPPVAPAPFETTQAYLNITAQIEDLRQNAGAVAEKASGVAAALQADIQRLEAELTKLRDEAAQYTLAEQQRERIRQLEAEEKRLAAEYESLEHGRHLCDEFLKAKVAMIEERINARFTSVRFRMFEQQVNGGLKEGCEVLVPTSGGRLVPFALANNAARINAGLEIIDTLGEHWGLSVPIIVDNAESVTRLRKTNAQQIRLVVSEPDKKLRVELEGDAMEAAS